MNYEIPSEISDNLLMEITSIENSYDLEISDNFYQPITQTPDGLL